MYILNSSNQIIAPAGSCAQRGRQWRLQTGLALCPGQSPLCLPTPPSGSLGLCFLKIPAGRAQVFLFQLAEHNQPDCWVALLAILPIAPAPAGGGSCRIVWVCGRGLLSVGRSASPGQSSQVGEVACATCACCFYCPSCAGLSAAATRSPWSPKAHRALSGCWFPLAFSSPVPLSGFLLLALPVTHPGDAFIM